MEFVSRGIDLEAHLRSLEDKLADTTKLLEKAKAELKRIDRVSVEKKKEFDYWAFMVRGIVDAYWYYKQESDKLSKRVKTFNKIVLVHELEEKVESLKREKSILEKEVDHLKGIEKEVMKKKETLRGLEAQEAEKRKTLFNFNRARG